MNDYPSHILQNQEYVQWRGYLLRFPWEWMVTLTFKDEVKFFTAQHCFKRWRLWLIREEKLRIAAYMLSSYKKGRIHLHALLFGRNRFDKTLSDCSPRQWKDAWLHFGFARITPITDRYKACDYLALHFLGFKSDYAEGDFYDNRLLKKEMWAQRDGLDGYDGLR